MITAAHCVYDREDGSFAAPASVTVGYGSATTGTLSSASVSEVTIPSQYPGQPSYDVALLDLAAPLAGYGGTKARAILPASASTLNAGLETEGRRGHRLGSHE